MTPRPDLPWTPPLPVIGLLGGVASGKSLVAQRLLELGCGLLDGDRAGHNVLRLPVIEQAARQRWGDAIFGPDGHIARPSLAAIVFAPTPAGATELLHLEQLTHPRIGEELRRQTADMAASGSHPALVLDAPVMLKSGWDKLCTQIWFVDAPREARLARALARGWTGGQFTRREAAQEPIEIKRRRADVIIDNSGTREETWNQIDRQWELFQKQHAQESQISNYKSQTSNVKSEI